MTATDVRVVAMRALALGVLAPLLVAAYAVVERSAFVQRAAPWLGEPLPWFWRFVLFLVIAVVVPVSFVERLATRPDVTARRALVAALITAPGAMVAMAQTAYAPHALSGDLPTAGARAFAALKRPLLAPPREVVAAALALAAPFAVLTFVRVRALSRRVQLAASLVVGVGGAAFALHVVAGLPHRTWLFRRTDLWTALCAALLPLLYAAVDALERRRTSPPGTAASAPTSVA